MVRKVCPRCGRVYIADPMGSNDFVHECDSGKDVLDQEDIVVIGNWEEEDGTQHVVSTRSQMVKSTVDKNFGNKPYCDDDDVEPLTKRGKRKSTHESRQHYEYIENIHDR